MPVRPRRRRRERPARPAGAGQIPVAVPVRPRRSGLRWWAAGGAAVALVGLLAAGGAGWWLLKRVNGAGGWTRYNPPDAPEVGLEFPAPPADSAEQIATIDPHTGKAVRHDPLWVFKCELLNGETYAMRAEELPWEEVRAIPAEQLRQGHLTHVPRLLRGADQRQFQYRSVPTAGYPSNECFVPDIPGRGYVFRMLLVDGRLYTLFVSGPGVTPESPRVVRFFDSFRHARVTPEEAAEPPPDVPDPDALRLLARVPAHNAAVFAPRQNAVLLSTGPNTPDQPRVHPATRAPVKWLSLAPEGLRMTAPAHLARYHYPSFRLEAAAPVAASVTAVAVDETGEWVRGWGDGPSENARRAVGDVTHPAPAPRSGWAAPSAWGRPQEPTRYDPAGVTFASAGRSLSADRARLYSMSGTDRTLDYASGREYDGGLLRAFDYPALTPRGELTVRGARGGAAVAPDAARVYVATGPAEHRPAPRAVVEVDADTLRVLREVPIRSNVAHVAAIGGGRVIGFGWGSGRGNTQRRYALAALIDLNADPPRELLIDLRGHPNRHLLHGDRLYTLGNWELHSFDVSGAASARIRLLGATYSGATEMVLSPDGKYLILNDGCVYWVGGAGPLPPVDPGARW